MPTGEPTDTTNAPAPLSSARRENAEAGGLVAYGPSLPDQVRQAVTYVDQGGTTKRIRSAREESFSMIADWMTIVRELDRAGKSWMWFDTGEPMGSWFR